MLRLLSAGFSPPKLRISTGPVRVGFVVDKVTLGEDFWEKFSFLLSADIIIPGLRIHVYLRATITGVQGVEAADLQN
jgi:hypothetical protein